MRRVSRHFLHIQEAVVLIAQIPRRMAHGDLLGQARAQRVGPRDDNPVIHAQLQERVPARPHLGDEILMRHGNLAVLMPALLFIGNLILDLQGASPSLDHLLRQQISGFRITKSRVDIRDDRHHMRFVTLHLRQQLGLARRIAGLARRIDLPEQPAQLPRIRLPQERVNLLDQLRHGRLFMHALIGQGAKLGPQRRHHPPRQINIPPLRGAEMLLHRNHLLLRDKPVPRPKALRIQRRIRVIRRHIGPHDRRRILRDIQPGAEPVLQPHPRHRLGTDAAPRAAAFDQLSHMRRMLLIGGLAGTLQVMARRAAHALGCQASRIGVHRGVVLIFKSTSDIDLRTCKR